jgi:hypothetical protein
MTDSLRQQLERWQMGELLRNYPGLRLSSVTASHVKMRGALLFSAQAPDKEQITDEFQIAIAIPHEFPQEIPSVREIAGRIPGSFHKLNDGSLCLGSPTRLRLALLGSDSIASFVERCVVPYLYGYSYFEKHRTMPFGELTHGTLGLCQDLAPLYGTNHTDAVPQFVRLTSMKKRKANKKPCPCGSQRRLGECHHRRVNALRNRLGRNWFRRILGGPGG